MNSSLNNRLEALENEMKPKPLPTYEEWVSEWEDTDELSKALIEDGARDTTSIIALNRTPEENERYALYRKYLQRMGIIEADEEPEE